MRAGNLFGRYFFVLIALEGLIILLAASSSAVIEVSLPVSLHTLTILGAACCLGAVVPWTIDSLKRLCFCLTAAGTVTGIAALTGAAGVFLGADLLRFTVHRPSSMFGLPQVLSFFGNPNSFGLFLVFSIAASAVLFVLFKVKEKIFPATVLLISIVLIQLPALFLTFSRASWLALALFAACFAWYQDRRLFNISPLLLSAVVLFSTWTCINGNNLIDIPLSILNGRGKLWAEAARLFMENPLLGTGLGGWEAITGYTLPVHNTYLHLAVELGISGLALYLAAVLLFMYNTRRALSGEAAGTPRHVFLSALYSLGLGLLVHQFFESYLIGGLPLFLPALAVFYRLTSEPLQGHLSPRRGQIETATYRCKEKIAILAQGQRLAARETLSPQGRLEPAANRCRRPLNLLWGVPINWRKIPFPATPPRVRQSLPLDRRHPALPWWRL